LNPSHLFNHNGNGLCVLSNQISLSLMPKCFGRVVVF
jgi:hypothetical protein